MLLASKKTMGPAGERHVTVRLINGKITLLVWMVSLTLPRL